MEHEEANVTFGHVNNRTRGSGTPDPSHDHTDALKRAFGGPDPEFFDLKRNVPSIQGAKSYRRKKYGI
jgi:hypothetical protein